MSKFFGSRILMLAIALLTFFVALPGEKLESWAIANSFASTPAKNSQNSDPRNLDSRNSPLTTPRIHPLPPKLALGESYLNSTTGSSAGSNAGDDYFTEIKSTPLGYLIWSQFPIKVYLDQPPIDISFSEQERFTSWTRAVEQALQEWQQYLPLVIISQPEAADLADIKVLRSFPPQRATRNPTTGLLEIPRAAAAQARYEFYLQTPQSILAHRFTIYLSPNQTEEYTLATARHELGHALGLWGHSPLETDIMYFSQVRTPPPISPRDINTLRRIYQQPTQLGWQVEGTPTQAPPLNQE